MMKRLLFVAAVMIAGTSFGQVREISGYSEAPKFDLNNFERSTDTLGPVAFGQPCAANGLVIYNSNNGGYVMGTNGYGDLEKAQLWPTVTGEVEGIRVGYGAKESVTGTTMYNAKIYEWTGTAVGSVLGTSTAVPFSAIDTSGGFTEFLFSPAITISNSNGFVTSVTVDGQDTVGIVSTTDPCAPSAALELTGTTWGAVAQTWPLQIDMVMLVLINNVVIHTNVGDNIKSEVDVFYANDQLNITGIVEGFDITSVMVMDINGKIVKNFGQPLVSGGKLNFPLNGLANGNYVAVLNSNIGDFGIKFNVTK